MTKNQFTNEGKNLPKPKGWFGAFLLNVILPWLWENREAILKLLKKSEAKPIKSMTDGDPDPGTTPPPPEDN